MADPSLECPMGSGKDCQEAVVSRSTGGSDWEEVGFADSTEQGQKAVASLDVKSECPEKGQDVVASLDGLAECIASVKPFATETVLVLEKCQKLLGHEITSFTDLRAKLQDVCESCYQEDRLIIAGSGNVGKSTIANAFLGGEKFWPTASFCMTSRICEASYDESSDGKPISKDLVHKSAQSEPQEFQEMKTPLKVCHPSPLLKPDVILVDLPGLDQEEHMERLDEYMKCHPSSSVVLLYAIDVKNKICSPDRRFLEKLMKSPWQSLSQGLGLLVNKCDVGGDGNSSDEEIPDYPKLIADITKETQNYCTPVVMDLSTKDKKKKHPTAMEKWQTVEDYANTALAQLKCKRLLKIALSLEKVMDLLRLAIQDGERLDKRENDLSLAEAKVKELLDSKNEWVRRRVQEMRQTLRERQEGHLNAILEAGVPHINERAFTWQLAEVEGTVRDRIHVMVANDIELSLKASVAFSEAVRNVFYGAGFLSTAIGFIVSSATPYSRKGLKGSSVAIILFFSFYTSGNLVLIAAGVGTAISSCSLTRVDEGYVRKLFAEMYEKVVEEYPPKVAEQEHDCIVKQAKTDLEEQRTSLQCLREQVGSRGVLDDELKTECSKLQGKFTSLKKGCNEMLRYVMK